MKRRQFIRQASCAAIGSTTMLSTLLNLKATNAASIANSSVFGSDDYKALVCVLLDGGNDSYNMLVPRSGQSYQDYKLSRSNNALDNNTLLPVNSVTSDGREFGLHPSMPHVQRMFNEGKIAFLNNIGTLVEPTTPDQYYLKSVQLPLGLLSHVDQIKHWQTAFPQDRAAIGWGGRMSDMILDMNNNTSISMNISLGGSNIFQSGVNSNSYAIDPITGPVGISGFELENDLDLVLNKSINNLLDQTYADVYEKTYVDVIKNSRDSYLQFNEALSMIQPDSVVYPDDVWRVGQSFKTVKNTIAARSSLDVQRQSFFIHFPGWDHHDEVINSQATQLAVLDNALDSFQRSLALLGMEDKVITFVISDFARGLLSNGNGTDHAWGGNVFVVGGPIYGGEFYGNYPDLALSSPLDVGGGIFLPELSVDEYFAELAMWFGVPAQDLPIVLPNIRNFYDINSGEKTIGFIDF
jgi:uncharacterized protein (DUF1501 family)